MIKQLAYGYPFKPSNGCFGYSSCFLIDDNKKILFDTGAYNIRSVIYNILNEVECVVISHLHFDHCSNLDLFINTGIPIYISKKELDYYEKNKNNDIDLFSYFDYIKDFLNIIPIAKPINLSLNTNIIFTPGHTPGHLSLTIKDDSNNIILAGDSIKTYIDYNNEKLYGNAYCKEDYIKTKKQIKEKFNVIYPGHSNSIVNGVESNKMEVKEF